MTLNARSMLHLRGSRTTVRFHPHPPSVPLSPYVHLSLHVQGQLLMCFDGGVVLWSIGVTWRVLKFDNEPEGMKSTVMLQDGDGAFVHDPTHSCFMFWGHEAAIEVDGTQLGRAGWLDFKPFVLHECHVASANNLHHLQTLPSRIVEATKENIEATNDNFNKALAPAESKQNMAKPDFAISEASM